MLDKEKIFILSIKYTLEPLFEGWEGYDFSMFLQDAGDYLGISRQELDDAKTQVLCWQIAVNIIYHLMINNIIKFDKEPIEIDDFNENDKIKWRVNYIKRHLARFSPYGSELAVWYSFNDLTTTGMAFMASCINDNDEINDQKFIRNFIDYFEIKNLKEWIECPIIQVSNT